MREEAPEVIAAVAASVGGVYVIAHVVDDIGEATVRGALEAHGLIGAGRGQVPAHR